MQKSNQRGSILIFLTLSFALLGTFIGFAVDFGRAYLQKARISRLVDAASLAAAKALQGQTGFEDEATRAACDSMVANGAPVVMSGTGACQATTGAPFTVAVNFFDAPVAGGPPIKHVEVTGTEPMPTTFLRFLGWMVPGDFSTLNVAATAQAAPERPVDLMLVLDRSGSMSATPPGSSQNKLQMMKTAVNAFLDNNFTGNDRIGMISFSNRGCGNASGGDSTATTCTPDVPLTAATSSNISMLKNRVNGLDLSNLTNTMEALRTARPAMAAVFSDPDRALTRKAVLLVTDGKPTVMRIDSDAKCKQEPKNNASLPFPGNTGTFSSGCLQSATSGTGANMQRRLLDGSNTQNIPAFGTDPTLFKNVISCTRSLSSCNGTNGAMYEADLLRNCGTGNSSCSASGAHDVLVFAIGIGDVSNTPNASFDKNAKCLLARISNATDVLNTGNNTLETITNVCSTPPVTYSDGDTYADLQDGCSGACTINSNQEKGKVYIVDTSANVPAQLQQVFQDIAALLKLRLTL
jgi:Flp pilus assembly protein TadG